MVAILDIKKIQELTEKREISWKPYEISADFDDYEFTHAQHFDRKNSFYFDFHGTMFVLAQYIAYDFAKDVMNAKLQLLKISHGTVFSVDATQSELTKLKDSII